MSFKHADKLLIFHKIIFQQLTQPRVGNSTDKSEQLFIHTVHTLLRSRHIIRRIVFTLFCFSDLTDVHLQTSVITCHITKYFDEILLIILCDPLRIRIPYFSIQCSRLIL